MGTGDASRACPLGEIPGDTRARDRAGGHPWIGGGPESCHRPVAAPWPACSILVPCCSEEEEEISPWRKAPPLCPVFEVLVLGSKGGIGGLLEKGTTAKSDV